MFSIINTVLMANYVTRSDDSLSLLFLRCKTRLCERSSRKWWQQWKKSASSQSLSKIKKKYITQKQKPEKVLNIKRDNLGFSAAVRSASLSHKANVFLIGGMPPLPSPLPLFWDSLTQTVAFSTCEKDEKCQTDRRKDDNVRPWDAPQFFSDLQEDFFFFPSPSWSDCVCLLQRRASSNSVLRHFNCTCSCTCTSTCNSTQCVQQKCKGIGEFSFVAQQVCTIQNNWHLINLVQLIIRLLMMTFICISERPMVLKPSYCTKFTLPMLS